MRTFTLLTVMWLAGTALAQQPRIYKAPEFEKQWSQPTLHPDRIVLNLSEDPSSGVSVTWRTSPEIKVAYAEVAIATAAPKFWRNAKTIEATTTTFDGSEVLTAEVIANYHSADFRGLLPDTTYAYRVGDGKRWSEWIQFRTASASSDKPFSFLYLGDAQNFILELWSRLIREGYRKAPDARFIVHAGDLVNDAHRDHEWQEWFDAGGWIHSSLPSFPIPGNHEYRPLNEMERDSGIRSLSAQWRHQFTLPDNGPAGLEETTYYMDYQDMRIIGLNSNEQHEVQAAWLEEVLAATTQKWKVVTFHHPLFSASDGRSNDSLRALWKPIFDRHQVDIALQGHDHAYARGRTSPDANVLDGVNMRDRTGTVYVVSVSGGKMYGLRPNAWEGWEAERDRAAENTQLFQVITVKGDTLSFESYTAVGELYDAFDLIKNEKGPNTFVERKQEAIPARRFSNTIPYRDVLPEAIRAMLLTKYEGFAMEGFGIVEVDGETVYRVELKSPDKAAFLYVSPAGDIIREFVREVQVEGEKN